MKKNVTYFILFLSAFCFTSSSIAQINSLSQVTPKKKWMVSHVNFGIGANWNQFNSMSLDELMVFAKNPEQMQRDLSNMTEEATPTTAGVALHVSMSLSPLNFNTGEYRKNRELQFGLALHSGKEAMVSYKNQDLDTSIVFCNIHGELSLEGSYLFKGQWGKRFHWYAGGGLNSGFTFGNQMILISGEYFEPGTHPSTQVVDETAPEPEKYEAKSVFYSRAFIPYGIHYRVGKRMTLGFDFRSGIGWQFIGGEYINYMRKSSSFAIGGKYML